MIASESVLLPEPFGPMIACTEPLSTTRSIPLRIVLPSTLTTRSLISRLDMHTLPRRGLPRLAGQDTTAARAALPVHETGLAKRGDELLEIGLGQVLSLRDGVQRDGPLAPVLGEVDHEPHPVLAARGDMEGRR